MDVITNTDLYELFGIPQSSSVQEIKKAYRKKALSCHPDKNPDNPRAAELFHELSRALEILTDVSARAAYDKVITARQQAKLRVRELDSKRKKLKEELEAREEAYSKSLNTVSNVKSDEQKLQAEVERLRKEGSKQVEEEIAFVRKQIFEQLHGSAGQSTTNSLHNRVKIKWKVDKQNPEKDIYDYDTLHRMLSKYGDITALVISSSKKGNALVEFQQRSAAEMAVQIEIGQVDNPLSLKALWDTEKVSQRNTQNTAYDPSRVVTNPRLFPIDKTSCDSDRSNRVNFPSAPDIFLRQSKISDAEFETSVLQNLRRVQERKRLLEQLKNEEGTSFTDCTS